MPTPEVHVSLYGPGASTSDFLAAASSLFMGGPSTSTLLVRESESLSICFVGTAIVVAGCSVGVVFLDTSATAHATGAVLS
jgi:hypothetical protein